MSLQYQQSYKSWWNDVAFNESKINKISHTYKTINCPIILLFQNGDNGWRSFVGYWVSIPRGRKISHNFDGIIIDKYIVNEWVKVIYSLFKEKKKISKIKNNLQKYNTSPSWRDIFFNVFYKNWKEVLNS